MKNRRRFVGVLTAMVLAIIGTVALVGYVRSAKEKAVAQESLVDVYIVDELVPKGADAGTIKSSVSLERVPTRLKQPGAIDDLDDVGTNVAATDLQPGDQLVEARLVEKEKLSDDVKDKVQISVLLEAERAVGGSLQKGDLVGVYLSFEPFDYDPTGQIMIDESGQIALANPGQQTSTTAPAASQTVAADPAAVTAATDPAATTDTAATTTTEATKKTPNMTRLAFQHVLVTNVQTTDTPVTTDDNDDEDDNGDVVAQVSGSQYVVTIALSPEQSERFVFATEFGHVWMSKDPATVSDDGTRLVTLGNVFTVVK
jgi:pilus assembly protein CpaB